jgi:hypothetical protein
MLPRLARGPLVGLLLGLLACGSSPSEVAAPSRDGGRPVLALAPPLAVAGGADQAAPAPPLELTASDGTGLRLVSIDARAVVEGPITLTEVHFVFHNPEPRVREGTFATASTRRARSSRRPRRRRSTSPSCTSGSTPRCWRR